MKLNLKNKLKSFFPIPEKNIQKEEHTKTFEKIKLFTLTKHKLFFGILTLLLIINLLTIFNLNYFYIRATLSFIFLVIIPGLLIMLMFKVREIGFWEYLVYTIGLSTSFIIFGGLAVNWILPWLNITDKPLSLYPILICFNIFLLGFWTIAWIKNKDLKPFDMTIPKLDWINRIFFIVPMLFPVLSVIGAFLLNNHGTNILTMIMIGGIAIYVFMIVIFKDKLNKNAYLWALYWMGLALLLSFSMRSWFISGWDSFGEVYIFNLVKEKLLWNISINRGNYNSCLSLSILPLIIQNFTKVADVYIFKLYFQIIFSFTPLVIFLMIKNYSKKIIAFLSIFFFIATVGFFELGQLFRQEIAFLFFALILLLISRKEFSNIFHKVLFIIFGLSIIVSHYSTTYIFVFLLIISYFIWRTFYQRKGIFLKFSSLFLIIIFMGAFLWHAQLTDTSSTLVDILKNSVDNFKLSINQNLKSDDASMSYHLNPFFRHTDYSNHLQDYLKDTSKEYIQKENIIPVVNKKYYTNLAYFKNSPRIFNYQFYQIILFLEQIIKILLKIFILLGIILFIFDYKKYFKRKLDLDFKILSMVFGFLLFVLIFLPILSTSYNVGRLFQQMLLILCFSGILGGLFFFRTIGIKKEKEFFVLSILLIIFFLFSYGFIYQFTGGNSELQLNNFGQFYWDGYSNLMEVNSALWLKTNMASNLKIYSDRISKKKLMLASMRTNIDDIFPGTISKNDYIYAGYTNTIKKISSKNYGGKFLFFDFPAKFINNNKNKIYNNGGSEIFK
jgi:uncharacterized membrane protein